MTIKKRQKTEIILTSGKIYSSKAGPDPVTTNKLLKQQVKILHVKGNDGKEWICFFLMRMKQHV